MIANVLFNVGTGQVLGNHAICLCPSLSRSEPIHSKIEVRVLARTGLAQGVRDYKQLLQRLNWKIAKIKVIESFSLLHHGWRSPPPLEDVKYFKTYAKFLSFWGQSCSLAVKLVRKKKPYLIWSSL